jgi:hypothetical protein
MSWYNDIVDPGNFLYFPNVAYSARLSDPPEEQAVPYYDREVVVAVGEHTYGQRVEENLPSSEIMTTTRGPIYLDTLVGLARNPPTGITEWGKDGFNFDWSVIPAPELPNDHEYYNAAHHSPYSIRYASLIYRLFITDVPPNRKSGFLDWSGPFHFGFHRFGRLYTSSRTYAALMTSQAENYWTDVYNVNWNLSDATAYYLDASGYPSSCFNAAYCFVETLAQCSESTPVEVLKSQHWSVLPTKNYSSEVTGRNGFFISGQPISGLGSAGSQIIDVTQDAYEVWNGVPPSDNRKKLHSFNEVASSVVPEERSISFRFNHTSKIASSTEVNTVIRAEMLPLYKNSAYMNVIPQDFMDRRAEHLKMLSSDTLVLKKESRAQRQYPRSLTTFKTTVIEQMLPTSYTMTSTSTGGDSGGYS